MKFARSQFDQKFSTLLQVEKIVDAASRNETYMSRTGRLYSAGSTTDINKTKLGFGSGSRFFNVDGSRRGA